METMDNYPEMIRLCHTIIAYKGHTTKADCGDITCSICPVSRASVGDGCYCTRRSGKKNIELIERYLETMGDGNNGNDM